MIFVLMVNYVCHRRMTLTYLYCGLLLYILYYKICSTHTL